MLLCSSSTSDWKINLIVVLGNLNAHLQYHQRFSKIKYGYFINIDDKRCTKQLVVRAKTIYKVILYLNATAIVTYNVISILLLYLLFYFSSSIMATIATDMKIIFFFFFFNFIPNAIRTDYTMQ
jgi:hypothetical protein